MNAKQFSLIFVGIFVALFAISAVSAAIVLNPTTSALSVGQGNTGSFTFTINNNDATSIYSNFSTLSSSSVFTSGTNTMAASNVVLSGFPTTLAPAATSSAVTVTFNVPANQTAGTYTGTITVDADGTASNPVSQTIAVTLTVTSNTPTEITTCSTTGNPGQLDISKIDFQNNGMQLKTFGTDDEWFPFEEIEVEMEVQNDGSNDVEDISVEWGLWNTQTNEWVIDLDEEDEINVKDGDEETMTVTFRLDDDLDVNLDDLTDGSDYRLYVIATGTVDNSTSPSTCVSDFETATIVIESDFVVLDNVEMPESLQCGETITVSADVWNIGDSDQDEVSLELTGREAVLGLSQDIAVGDIDAFDNQQTSFTFTLPRNLETKNYAIVLQVHDEDGDLYENDFDDDPAEFTIPISVTCGSGSTGSSADVSVAATLVSGGEAGKQMVVKATLTNNLNSMKTYTVSAAGYGEWASSASVDQSTVVLNAGQSRDVTFTLDVNKDASGPQSFFVEMVSGSNVVRQEVSANIEPKSGFGAIGSAFSGESWPIWAIGFLNLVLVIVIIIVAVRVARRK